MDAAALLADLKIPFPEKSAIRDPSIVSSNPATGGELATLNLATSEECDQAIGRATSAFSSWRLRPPPQRGELVRALGNRLRELKEPLAQLISLEMGKIISEARGEVQEMIDICDFAVGLSRQLYGLTIASERPNHRMMEQWHSIGPVCVITAFNFPMAVWAWNAALALVCGNTVVWKPSPHTPLTALAVHQVCRDIMTDHDADGVMELVLGGSETGSAMAADARFPLVSFTGSTNVGRNVGAAVARRLGRSLLELGGNNAIIVLDDADLDLAARAVVFGAVGTAGQRCTTTRRVLAHSGITSELARRVTAAYETVRIGDPRSTDTLMGPLISAASVSAFLNAVELATQQGAELLCGGAVVDGPGFFVQPTIFRVPRGGELEVSNLETFAPILYLFEVDNLDEAIERHNAVAHGLSSAIFTDSLRSAERFLSVVGSDCGIANVNIGTSGAEIGGAFGGEKDSGGGRESGSDAWKVYMRRQTCTVNYGTELPLAQGVEFL